MATTSYLYHALGLVGYKLMSTEYIKGEIHYHVERVRTKIRCPHCGMPHSKLIQAGPFERTFWGLPVGRRLQRVVLHGHRYYCKACARYAREAIPFTEGKRRYLKVFARYVVELCGVLPIKHVADLLQVSWDLVREIYQKHLAVRAGKRRLSKVKYIAVDEFATRKGHHYMTVVLDLETGIILYAHEGRDANALIPFLRQLKQRGVKLKAIALDMSAAYIKAIRTVFGASVDMVFDRFHVAKLLNEKIDDLRREIVRSDDSSQKTVLKGCRFVLLKGRERLSAVGEQRLYKLREVNDQLYQAYLLKEDLRLLWGLSDRETAESFLTAWIVTARATGCPQLCSAAATLERHAEGILNYLNHHISSGPIEGINNKIKVLKRQAYGFRNLEFLRLRLLFLHESTIKING